MPEVTDFVNMFVVQGCCIRLASSEARSNRRLSLKADPFGNHSLLSFSPKRLPYENLPTLSPATSSDYWKLPKQATFVRHSALILLQKPFKCSNKESENISNLLTLSRQGKGNSLSS